MARNKVDAANFSVRDNTNKSFGQNQTFIVDATHPSPIGVHFNYMRAQSDITGLSATDINLMSGSATYDTEYIAGTEFPSEYVNISIASGELLCKRF